MPIITVLVVLLVVGVLLWAVQSLAPIDPTIKKLIYVVVVVAVCIWLLQVFGLIGGVGAVRLGH